MLSVQHLIVENANSNYTQNGLNNSPLPLPLQFQMQNPSHQMVIQQETSPQQQQDISDEEKRKSKLKRVNKACVYCNRSHMSCENGIQKKFEETLTFNEQFVHANGV